MDRNRIEKGRRPKIVRTFKFKSLSLGPEISFTREEFDDVMAPERARRTLDISIQAENGLSARFAAAESKLGRPLARDEVIAIAAADRTGGAIVDRLDPMESGWSDMFGDGGGLDTLLFGIDAKVAADAKREGIRFAIQAALERTTRSRK